MTFSDFVCSFFYVFCLFAGKQNEEDDGELSARYQNTLDALSSLITKRGRLASNNQSHRFRLLFHYLKVTNHLSFFVCRAKIYEVFERFMNLLKGS
jgi:hypothetical protein